MAPKSWFGRISGASALSSFGSGNWKKGLLKDGAEIIWINFDVLIRVNWFCCLISPQAVICREREQFWELFWGDDEEGRKEGPRMPHGLQWPRLLLILTFTPHNSSTLLMLILLSGLPCGIICTKDGEHSWDNLDGAGQQAHPQVDVGQGLPPALSLRQAVAPPVSVLLLLLVSHELAIPPPLLLPVLVKFLNRLFQVFLRNESFTGRLNLIVEKGFWDHSYVGRAYWLAKADSDSIHLWQCQWHALVFVLNKLQEVTRCKTPRRFADET